MKKIFIFGLIALFCTGCNNAKTDEHRSEKRQEAEAAGQICIEKAREALSRRDLKAAREQILSLRENYRLALDAREDGILIMDSIELFEAQKALQTADSLLQTCTDSASARFQELKANFDEQCQRIKFYHRKIQHDKANQTKH